MFHQTNWNFPMVRVTRTKFYCGWQGNIGGCCTKTASHSLTSAAQIQRQDLQYTNIVQSMACTPMKNWQRGAKNCWRNRSLDFIAYKSTALFRATNIFQKDLSCIVGYGQSCNAISFECTTKSIITLVGKYFLSNSYVTLNGFLSIWLHHVYCN